MVERSLRLFMKCYSVSFFLWCVDQLRNSRIPRQLSIRPEIPKETPAAESQRNFVEGDILEALAPAMSELAHCGTEAVCAN